MLLLLELYLIKVLERSHRRSHRRSLSELLDFDQSMDPTDLWKNMSAQRCRAEELSSEEQEQKEQQEPVELLDTELEALRTCLELITEHGATLQRALSDLEAVRGPQEAPDQITVISETTALFCIRTRALINACRDFLELTESHSRRWQSTVQYEREQRVHLQETIEQLANQHSSLEHTWTEDPAPHYHTLSREGSEGASAEASEEDESEYFDAMEDSPAFITVTTSDAILNRSNLSEASGAHSNDWSQDEQGSPDSNHVSKQPTRRQRRTHIPHKPNYSLNLWSIMKNCVGKELSKIPMPVNFSEPLSMLQRLTEDLEYSELLDRAAACESSLEQMGLVAAFSVSSYSTTAQRSAKPFNPLLGETYELDRLHEHGYRSVCEQVSHHPPAAAHHAVSQRGWTLWKDITIASKFRGKYLSIMPLGAIHLKFHSSGNHYVWRKVTSTVHNIIVGKLWIDQSGDIEIVNHRTKDSCQLKFSPYSYFCRDIPRKVTGVVSDSSGQAHYILSGTWDDQIESAKIIQSSRGSSEGKNKTLYQTLPPKLLWKKYPLPDGAEQMYHFSSLALTLNEPEEGVAPTDSRLRPDQRLMEEGHWDQANAEKQRLEEKQRVVRRRREAEENQALSRGQEYEGDQPQWFTQRRCSITGEISYVYSGGYWECKEEEDWSSCPNIF